MSDYNIFPNFPDWFWYLLFALMVIWALSVVAIICYFIAWLISHIQIV